MNPGDLFILSPLVLIAAGAVLIMLVAAFYRSRLVAALLSLGTLAAAFCALPAVYSPKVAHVTALIVIDGYGLTFVGLVLGGTFAVAVLSYGYLEGTNEQPEEFYVLLMTACLGAAVVACSSHFASFFFGLEILNVSLYALIAYARRRSRGLEAALKYLAPAATADAFLLFGMALVYCKLGTMSFFKLQDLLVHQDGPIVSAGMAIFFLGIAFKLALVPSYMWAPDVYEGAPAPVTAFMATVSKGVMFVFLFRYFGELGSNSGNNLFILFSIMAVGSMFAGNLLGLLQRNVKRMLACSSIAHFGYVLVAFLSGGSLASAAVTIYLTVYFLMTLGAFGVIAVLSRTDREAETFADFQGLAWRRPWPALVLTTMLLSLAGIPVTAGFLAKLYILAAGAEVGRWALVVLLIVNSVIGLFYYFRLIVTLYLPVDVQTRAEFPYIPAAARVLLALLTLFVLFLGLYPGPLVDVGNIIKATV